MCLMDFQNQVSFQCELENAKLNWDVFPKSILANYISNLRSWNHATESSSKLLIGAFGKHTPIVRHRTIRRQKHSMTNLNHFWLNRSGHFWLNRSGQNGMVSMANLFALFAPIPHVPLWLKPGDVRSVCLLFEQLVTAKITDGLWKPRLTWPWQVYIYRGQGLMETPKRVLGNVGRGVAY